MANPYNLRSGTNKRDYKQMNDIVLPRVKRERRDKLYPIEVVERKGSRVKIHYVGYNDDSDEWRESSDIVPLSIPNNSSSTTVNTSNIPVPPAVQPYSLYNELGIKIKQSLTCGRKDSPLVKITMGFDYFLFTGGLQQAGIATNTVLGTVRYGIQQYSDLNFLLGTRWHYRGINKHGDYAYVVLSSIEFHLRKRRSVVDYHPPESPGRPITPSKLDTGYLLTFCFQRRYGNSSTFGRNRDIFNN